MDKEIKSPFCSITPVHCRKNYKLLAKVNPDYLIRWMENESWDPAHLSFALEYLGLFADIRKLSFSIFEKYLYHKSKIVQEGALYGIQSFFRRSVEEYRTILEFLIQNSDSKGVRDTALENFYHLNEI